MRMIYKQKEKFICWSGSCRREFYSSTLLLAHQYECSHFGLQCCVCDVTFFDKGSMRYHVKSVHFPEQYFCLQCSEEVSYKQKHSLYRHQLNVHGVIKCNQCGRGFSAGKYLREHVLQNHDYKPIKIEIFT